MCLSSSFSLNLISDDFSIVNIHVWGVVCAGYKVLQRFRVKLEFKDVSILQVRTAGST